MAVLELSRDKSATLWILLGIPVIFVFGGFMHFVYELSGRSVIAAIFTPVNESIWEHLKMSFWPILAWWIAGYLVLSRGSNIPIGKWILSCAAAEVACLLVIVSFYYTYTGALGISSLILDIFSLLLGIACGQCLALHIYNRAEPRRYLAVFLGCCSVAAGCSLYNIYVLSAAASFI